MAGTFAVVMLTFLGAPVAEYALHFGPAEFFALMVFGLATVASLTGTNVTKSVVTTCLGLMISTVGIDLVSGAPRYTFGNPFLQDGIDFVVVAIGMFAFTEVIITAREVKRGPARRSSKRRVSGSAGRSSFTACPRSPAGRSSDL